MAIRGIIQPNIILYNARSQNLFKALGFIEVSSNGREKSFQLKVKSTYGRNVT